MGRTAVPMRHLLRCTACCRCMPAAGHHKGRYHEEVRLEDWLTVIEFHLDAESEFIVPRCATICATSVPAQPCAWSVVPFSTLVTLLLLMLPHGSLMMGAGRSTSQHCMRSGDQMTTCTCSGQFRIM